MWDAYERLSGRIELIAMLCCEYSPNCMFNFIGKRRFGESRHDGLKVREAPRDASLNSVSLSLPMDYLQQAEPSHEQVWPSQFGQAHESQTQTAADTVARAIFPWSIEDVWDDEAEAVPQAHASQAQTSQPQASPVHPPQEQAIAVFSLFTAVTQHDLIEVVGTAVAALAHPQLPHWQSSQLQTPPEQSGHLQSTQPQADLAVGELNPVPPKARA